MIFGSGAVVAAAPVAVAENAGVGGEGVSVTAPRASGVEAADAEATAIVRGASVVLLGFLPRLFGVGRIDSNASSATFAFASTCALSTVLSCRFPIKTFKSCSAEGCDGGDRLPKLNTWLVSC